MNKPLKCAIPTWAWELKSKTLSYLKYRRDFKEQMNRYLDQELKFRPMNINRFLDSFTRVPYNYKQDIIN